MLLLLILLLGPVSGAHFHPVVTAADWALAHRSADNVLLPHPHLGATR